MVCIRANNERFVYHVNQKKNRGNSNRNHVFTSFDLHSYNYRESITGEPEPHASASTLRCRPESIKEPGH